jgi:hypothetical protein
MYHVTGRCIEHYQLFSDDADREHFLALLAISRIGNYLGAGNAEVSAMI